MATVQGYALSREQCSTQDQLQTTDAHGLVHDAVEKISSDTKLRDETPPLGFISIEVVLHRPPGDPFNEKTWPFPLIREKVAGSSEAQVVCSGPYDDSFIDRFVEAGQRLAERGAVGIITSCGFLAMAQTEYVCPVATKSKSCIVY
jgi:hypothetical protein